MLLDLLEPSDFKLITHPSLWVRKEIVNLCLLVKLLNLLCTSLSFITLRMAHIHYCLYPTVDFYVKQHDLLFFCDRLLQLVSPHLLILIATKVRLVRRRKQTLRAQWPRALFCHVPCKVTHPVGDEV